MATSRSQGISKVIIALSSINMPGLKFIAKTLKNDEFVQLGSSPRRPEVMNILKTGDADVISFGSVAYKISDEAVLHLTIPLSIPFKCEEENKVRIKKLSEWRQELQDLEEDEIKDEFYVIAINENGEFGEIGTSNKDGQNFVKKYFDYSPRIEQFTILYDQSNNVTIHEIAKQIKAEKEGDKDKKVDFDAAKNDERRSNSAYKRISTPKQKPKFDRLPKPDEAPKNWDFDEDESSEDEQDEEESKERSNTLQWFGLDQELAEKDQAKLKVDIRTISFEDLRDVQDWFKILQFQLDIQGITCERLRVGQLLSNLKTNLKTTVINKLGRMNTLPSMEKVYECLLECSMFTSIEAKKLTEKFGISTQKPVIEQFYRLKGMMERAWPQNSDKALLQMTRSKFEEKLPKTVTTEGLYKYRDDNVDTISYLKLVQKIIDSTEESRTVNVLSNITCNYCTKKGHKWKECRKRLREQGEKKGEFSKNQSTSQKCTYCNIPGHLWKDCRKRIREQGAPKPQNQNDKYQKKVHFSKPENKGGSQGNADFRKKGDSSKKIVCWNCNRTGHYKSECRAPPKINFLEQTQESGQPPSYENEFRGQYSHED